MAEGMAKGVEKERAKAESGKLDIARQLLGTGMPASQVALIMKLPLDTVNTLHKQQVSRRIGTLVHSFGAMYLSVGQRTVPCPT